MIGRPIERPAVDGKRYCKHCCEMKPLPDFYKSSRYTCAQCRRLQVASYKAFHEVELHETKARYLASPRCKQLMREYNQQRDPEVVRARALLNAAIVRGEIQRGPCAECGRDKTEGHHEDYTKPLEVVWLCPSHHRRKHSLPSHK